MSRNKSLCSLLKRFDFIDCVAWDELYFLSVLIFLFNFFPKSYGVVHKFEFSALSTGIHNEFSLVHCHLHCHFYEDNRPLFTSSIIIVTTLYQNFCSPSDFSTGISTVTPIILHYDFFVIENNDSDGVRGAMVEKSQFDYPKLGNSC